MVHYSLRGSTARDADYPSTGTVEVPADTTRVYIAILIRDHIEDDATETVILTLNKSTDYNVDNSNTKHTAFILDNVAPSRTPVVDFGELGNGTVEVEGGWLSETLWYYGVQVPITVNGSTDGTAHDGLVLTFEFVEDERIATLGEDFKFVNDVLART